jgi:starch-binding outer membrane protein, SusD/RagB family
MNKIMKKLFILFVAVNFYALQACKKMIDIDEPVNELTNAIVYESDATANAAQLGIYSRMANGGFSYSGLSIYPGLSADELTDYEGSQKNVQLFTNSLTSDNDGANELWSQAYEYIYASNAVLEGVEKSTALSANVKKQLFAEAKFTRAFSYFYLVNFFGDVPLLLTTDYKKNSIASRISRSDVYKQIVDDLIAAEGDLNADYLDATGVNVTPERLRPTKAVAAAMLARVYLYTEDYANAETVATSIINDSRYALDQTATLSESFLKNSSEAIWQLSTGTALGNTYEGFMYVLAYPPYLVALSEPFYDAFEPNDKRKENWVGTYSDGIDTWHYPYKYKIQYDPSNPLENVMVLRLAEQYLIRAEARAHLGNFTGAQEDLNIIRNRAGLSNTTANDQTSLLSAILNERRSELFTEWGHRWLDLKRTGKVDEVMQFATPQKGGVWESIQQWYPIPQMNRNSNPNLSQNEGYN